MTHSTTIDQAGDTLDVERAKRTQLLRTLCNYDRQGLVIFPLRAIVAGSDGKPQCSCGNPQCPAVGKHPRVRWTNLNKPAGFEQLAWWAYLYGVIGGWALALRASGLVIVESDPRNGGDEDMADLVERYGPLPDTLRCFSGGGGVHHYFCAPPDGVLPPKTKINLYNGIELLSGHEHADHIAVLPPSPHKSGNFYRWDLSSAPDGRHAAIADLPQSIIDLAWQSQAKDEDAKHRAPAATVTSGYNPAPIVRNIPANDVYDRARAYLATLPPAVSGQGGSKVTFRAACKLVHGYALSVDEALPLLQEYSDRCQPPWSDAELLHKLRSADLAPSHEPRGYLLHSDQWHAGLDDEFADLDGVNITIVNTATRTIEATADPTQPITPPAETVFSDGEIDSLAKDIQADREREEAKRQRRELAAKASRRRATRKKTKRAARRELIDYLQAANAQGRLASVEGCRLLIEWTMQKLPLFSARSVWQTVLTAGMFAANGEQFFFFLWDQVKRRAAVDAAWTKQELDMAREWGKFREGKLPRKDGCGICEILGKPDTGDGMVAKFRCRQWSECEHCRLFKRLREKHNLRAILTEPHIKTACVWRGPLDDAGKVRREVKRLGGLRRQFRQEGGYCVIVFVLPSELDPQAVVSKSRVLTRCRVLTGKEAAVEACKAIDAVPCHAGKFGHGSQEWGPDRVSENSADKLRQAIRGSGLSLARLAADAGLQDLKRPTPITAAERLRLFLSGERKLSIAALRKLRKVLGLSFVCLGAQGTSLEDWAKYLRQTGAQIKTRRSVVTSHPGIEDSFAFKTTPQHLRAIKARLDAGVPLDLSDEFEGVELVIHGRRTPERSPYDFDWADSETG